MGVSAKFRVANAPKYTRRMVVGQLVGRITPAKRFFEFAFWTSRRAKERRLNNEHYRRYYTEVFGLDEAFFAGKRLLDVGCGPRGSLEWASMAADRVGVDPLADAYRLLGTGRHTMRYVSARAEALPFEDGSFDVVSCVNALDHVEDVDQAVRELTRVTVVGGTLLLIVDVHHEPTHTEPHTLDWSVLDSFKGCTPLLVHHFERYGSHWESLVRQTPYDHANAQPRLGLLVARLTRERG